MRYYSVIIHNTKELSKHLETEIESRATITEQKHFVIE